MGVNRPYRRTCRQFVDGSYFSGDVEYVLHPKYAESPKHYIRAFFLLQKDLLEIFDYIEPAYSNRKCYSFRILELLIRACVEVEANFKAILKENGYIKANDNYWNMNDYKKIEQSHCLSSYRVKLPVWDGKKNVRKPFANWSREGSLPWYSAYNGVKHDRHATFKKANFENMIEAVSGLLVLLSSQFLYYEYTRDDFSVPVSSGLSDGMEPAIGKYFEIKYPNKWPKKDRYDFDWQQLEGEDDPFQQFPYPKAGRSSR